MKFFAKRIIKRAIKIVTGCTLLYKTEWYKSLFVDFNHQIYPSNIWYREHDERNFDIVNLGSSGGKWAFDYNDTWIKGMNWAQQPQTLLEDYNLLRNFHSILRKDGYVIITIMPFTSLNKTTGVMDAMKYLKIGSHSPIQPYKLKYAQLKAEYPILFKKRALKELLKYFLKKEKIISYNVNTTLEYNPMNEEQLKQDAADWIECWKKQFNISDFDAPLTSENQKGRNYRIKLMQEMIDFCIERGYKPVYVIPPVTEYLSKYYTSSFEKNYIYNFLHEVNRNILTLDYSKRKNWKSKDLYFNSFFLNSKGRKLFTKQVLMDIGLINS